MARLDAGLTQGLMNPTYQKELGQVGGMLGGMGAHMRQTRRDKEEAQNMAGMTSEQLMARQREIASTPAEAIAAGKAQEQFGRQQADRKKAERKDKDLKAKEHARARLSAMGTQRDILLRSGKADKAAAILKGMEEIAVGAGVELGKYTGAVQKDDRYKAVGASIFDKKTGQFINDETGETEDADSMNENEFAQRIFQNKEAYTPESWAEYSKGITENGVRKASEVLVPVDVVKEAAGASASKVTDASRVLGVIDDMLALAPESMAGAVKQAALSGVPWTDYQALETKTNTLRANTAFDRLQKMRDSSKTGGALGQVSEKELALLQDNLAALKPTSKTFRQDLEVIKQAYQRIIDIEMGPDSGSPNYQTGPDGRVFYRDATSGIVYDYATGNPVPKRG